MKRLVDLLAAVFGMVILFPLLAVIAFLVKLSSPGPILYSQIRVGRNGELFRMHKFRTMRVDSDKVGTSITVDQDPRVIPMGRILRKLKLDELPQLWNVAIGEMSLVGPRPDVPEIVATYSAEMRRVLEYLPGITSIASLHLRNEEEILSLATDPEKAYLEILVPLKVKLAMEHVHRNSFWFDLTVLIKTIYVLSLGRLWPLPELPEVKQARNQLGRQ